MPYSWYNIRSIYANNKLHWRKKTDSAWTEITFPDGIFTYDDMNAFIQKKIGKVDPSNKESDELFELFFDNTIYRAVILLKDIEIDLSQGKFAELLGFEKESFGSSNKYFQKYLKHNPRT